MKFLIEIFLNTVHCITTINASTRNWSSLLKTRDLQISYFLLYLECTQNLNFLFSSIFLSRLMFLKLFSWVLVIGLQINDSCYRSATSAKLRSIQNRRNIHAVRFEAGPSTVFMNVILVPKVSFLSSKLIFNFYNFFRPKIFLNLNIPYLHKIAKHAWNSKVSIRNFQR